MHGVRCWLSLMFLATLGRINDRVYGISGNWGGVVCIMHRVHGRFCLTFLATLSRVYGIPRILGWDNVCIMHGA